MHTTEISHSSEAVLPPEPAPAEAVRPPRRSVLGDFREILREVWEYRELAYQLMVRDIRIRYKQAVMGFAWAILMPVLIVAAGTLVRFAMSYMGGGELQLQEIAGMALKALPWAFFVGAIGFASSSLVGNATLVSKVYFPREVLPLSATLAQGFDTSIGAAALLLALPFLGVEVSVAMLWAVPVIVLLFILTTATALFLGCANLFFRDVKYIVQVLLTFGIFFTPVFFEPQMFGATGAQVMMLNPMAPLLEGLRLSVIGGHDLATELVVTSSQGTPILAWSPWYLVYSAVWAIGGLLGAALLFHRSESVFAEYV